MAGVCTGPGECDTKPIGTGRNWVTEVNGLPLYIRAIARAFLRKQMPESQAIRLAVGIVRRWAKGAGQVTPATRQRAAKALKSWDDKKAAAHSMSRESYMTYGNDLFTWKPPIDLAGGLDRMLGTEAAVRKAWAAVSKLPKALQPSAKARILARAKALKIELSAASPTIDLAVDQAQRDACKKAGLTFPGTDAYPLGDASGKFSRAMATKAIRMVGLGSVGSASAIRKWLASKLKANGAGDLIPSAWDLSITDSMESAWDFSITENMAVYAPKGDERDTVVRQLRGISALRKSGRTKQADAAHGALVRSKTSRARKMPDGSTRAHTPSEVEAGLGSLG